MSSSARVTSLRIMAASLAFLSTALDAPAARAEDSWDGVARVVAVGDVHGDYGQFFSVLRAAGVVDEKGHWSGGRTHLVQVGDRIDRGPDSRKVMDLVMRLEGEARKAGGFVHPLLGNHEAMNMMGDLRYTTPEEFAAFRSPASADLAASLWTNYVHALQQENKPAPSDEERKRFEAEHPLGWVEQRRAFSPDGKYGAWLSRQDAVIRIGDALFLHGGISPKYADFSLHDLNERIRQELKEPDPRLAVVSTDPEGPLWFRGLASGDPALLPSLEAILKRHGARRMVIGHTVTEGLVKPLYGGRVLAIDVGMTKVFGGPPASLLLEGGHAFAIHRGRRLALPEGEGEPLVRYVQEVMALEPDPSRLKGLLRRLQAGVTAPSSAP
jgi:Calcineurin-like phosphoesterase